MGILTKLQKIYMAYCFAITTAVFIIKTQRLFLYYNIHIKSFMVGNYYNRSCADWQDKEIRQVNQGGNKS